MQLGWAELPEPSWEGGSWQCWGPGRQLSMGLHPVGLCLCPWDLVHPVGPRLPPQAGAVHPQQQLAALLTPGFPSPVVSAHWLLSLVKTPLWPHFHFVLLTFFQFLSDQFLSHFIVQILERLDLAVFPLYLEHRLLASLWIICLVEEAERQQVWGSGGGRGVWGSQGKAPWPSRSLCFPKMLTAILKAWCKSDKCEAKDGLVCKH